MRINSMVRMAHQPDLPVFTRRRAGTRECPDQGPPLALPGMLTWTLAESLAESMAESATLLGGNSGLS